MSGDEKAAGAAQEMTAAQAAKLVKRTTVSEDKNGKRRTSTKAIAAKEVLSFKDYGDHVMVVTVDGQKFRGDKQA